MRQIFHGAGGEELRRRVLRAQQGGQYGIEVAAADDTAVEGLAVDGEGDSVRAEGDGCDGLAHARVVVGGHTPDLEEEAGFRAHGFDVVEVAPGGAMRSTIMIPLLPSEETVM